MVIIYVILGVTHMSYILIIKFLSSFTSYIAVFINNKLFAAILPCLGDKLMVPNFADRDISMPKDSY